MFDTLPLHDCASVCCARNCVCESLKEKQQNLLYTFSEILLEDGTTKLTSLFALWEAGMRAKWLCRINNFQLIRTVTEMENNEQKY